MADGGEVALAPKQKEGKGGTRRENLIEFAKTASLTYVAAKVAIRVLRFAGG